MEWVAATNNQNKLAEMQRILDGFGYQVLSLAEVGIDVDVEETGTTFAENALLKAREICKLASKPTIADDSGLCVDALQGAPGVYSARYAGAHGDDKANNQKLLAEMEDIPTERRGGQFVSAIAVVWPNGTEKVFEGTCAGVIGLEEKGSNGFGYDPLFYVGEKTYAEMTDDEKDAISHRAKALQKLKEYLKENE